MKGKKVPLPALMKMEIGHSSQLCGFQRQQTMVAQQSLPEPHLFKKKTRCKYCQINPVNVQCTKGLSTTDSGKNKPNKTGKEKSYILIEVSSLCLLTWLNFIRNQLFYF